MRLLTSSDLGAMMTDGAADCGTANGMALADKMPSSPANSGTLQTASRIGGRPQRGQGPEHGNGSDLAHGDLSISAARVPRRLPLHRLTDRDQSGIFQPCNSTSQADFASHKLQLRPRPHVRVERGRGADARAAASDRSRFDRHHVCRPDGNGRRSYCAQLLAEDRKVRAS